jgi:CRISPR-associated protein Csb1
VPAIDYAKLDVFSDEEKQKSEGNAKSPLAQRGFVAVPATGAHGGVVARGPIIRDITINLVSLRRLNAASDVEKLRRYVLGLALVAATEPLDGFLRAGCLLVPRPEQQTGWEEVSRTGVRTSVPLTHAEARRLASQWAREYGVGPSRKEAFAKDLAKADLGSKGEKGGKAKGRQAK